MSFELPQSLRGFIVITEVDDSRPFFGEIFRRTFNDPIPSYRHHIGVFHRSSGGQFTPVSYLHVLPYGEIMLVGGACTDGRAFRYMSEAEGQAIRRAGGLLLQSLRYATERLHDGCEAFFGYCADARVYEVAIQAGFEPTGHGKLIACWHKALEATRRRSLVARAYAIGPF